MQWKDHSYEQQNRNILIYIRPYIYNPTIEKNSGNKNWVGMFCSSFQYESNEPIFIKID